MAKYGNFDTWMNNTLVLIQIIQELDRAYIRNLTSYTSPEFSFKYNREDCCQTTFKYNVKTETNVPIATQSIGVHPVVSTWTNPHSVAAGKIGSNALPSAMMGSYMVSSSIDQIIINCDSCFKINYIKWVRKNSQSTQGIISTSELSNFEYQDGGMVRNSFLFLPDDKLMIDGVVYKPDSPDAFNNDISATDEEQSVRFLDMLHFREKFNTGLIN